METPTELEQENADLRRMNQKLKEELAKALEAVASARRDDTGRDAA